GAGAGAGTRGPDPSEEGRRQVPLSAPSGHDMVAPATMATVDELTNDFSTLPVVPEGVFTAPFKRPAHVGEDWLEPKQRDYSSDDDAIWNALFERQMDVLPGRACDAFFAGLQKLHLDRGGVPEFARLSEGLG